MAHAPVPIELDVLAIFLARMPFLALPAPPRYLALPGPSFHVASVTIESYEPVAHAVAAPPSPAKPKPELGPSPFDPGFLPPSDLRTGPEAPGPDPRTLSRNRRPSTTTLRATPLAPIPTTNPRAPAETATHDILILPQSPTFRTADHGLQAVINYLRTAQMFSPRAVHTTPEGLVYDLVPDVFVHQVFIEGAAPGGAPSVLEATLRSLKNPMPVRYGPPTRQSCFSLELVGCRFGFVIEAFKSRLQQILYLRPEVHVTAHDPERLRAQVPEHKPFIPAFDMQEVDRG